jgi:peptidyl-prolyl cis-trans isomerase C
LPRDSNESGPAARLSEPPARQGIRRWLREPLLHFALIGAALFGLHSLVAPQRPHSPGSRIELTPDDVRQMDIAWQSKWQRSPTPAEWRDLIEEKVREEVLYREAVAMGLDQDDVIVRRRMGQKLEFLIEDVSDLPRPTTAELKAWFGRNASQFALPGKVTFCHVYFLPNEPVGQAAARAARASAILKGRTSCNSADLASLGDRFPEQDYYAERTPDEVAGIFGTQFAADLFKLRPGHWEGPIQSGLGSHLVLIESLAPNRLPAFDEGDRAQIESAWLDSKRAEAKAKVFDAMRAKYEVIVPKPSTL